MAIFTVFAYKKSFLEYKFCCRSMEKAWKYSSVCLVKDGTGVPVKLRISGRNASEADVPPFNCCPWCGETIKFKEMLEEEENETT